MCLQRSHYIWEIESSLTPLGILGYCQNYRCRVEFNMFIWMERERMSHDFQHGCEINLSLMFIERNGNNVMFPQNNVCFFYEQGSN